MRTANEIADDLRDIIKNGMNGYSYRTITTEVDKLAAAAGHDGYAGGGRNPAEDAQGMLDVLTEIGAI